MSNSAPSELSASSVIALIESGAYPRDIVITIARGFLPLPQDDLITVLAYLANSPEADYSTPAREALRELPSRALQEHAADESLSAEHLERLIRAVDDEFILERLIRNRQVSDATVERLAATAGPRLQEVIVINHERVLRSRGILEALLANPALSPDVRRRITETNEEFFVKVPRPQQSAVETLGDLAEYADEGMADAPADAIVDLLEKAAEAGDEPHASTIPVTESEKEDLEAMPLLKRLSRMNVSQKVHLAFRGNRTVRMLLVRERNKLVCSSVMRNPRMTEQEAEAIAGMRNVEDEVLRLISMRRDWMSKYPVMIALVRNPKAPLGVVLPLINRLTLRDLKSLRDDKGVAQTVRETARKLYVARKTS